MFCCKNHTVYFVILLIFLLGYKHVIAQKDTSNQPSDIIQISSQDGLSQVSIMALAKDKDGFIWIGTMDGLNRYDGTHIKKYYNHPKDSTSLNGNYISHLFYDATEKLWVGTSNYGLSYYDSEAGNFKKPHLEQPYKGILQNSSITNIMQDTLGFIWVSTLYNGIYRLQEAKGNNFRCDKIDNFPEKSEVSALYVSANKIWVGTKDAKIFYAEIAHDLPIFKPLHVQGIKGRIMKFAKCNNALFVGTAKGLWKVNSTTKTAKFYNLLSHGNENSQGYYVNTLALNSKDELWVGTGNGLCLIMNANAKYQDEQLIFYNEKSRVPISHNTVYALLVEKDILWVGTAKNLDVFNFNTPKFNTIRYRPGAGLDNTIVLSVFKEDKRLWVGTAGGLNLFTNDTVYHFTEDGSDTTTLSDEIVKSIVDDTQGHLWFGTTKGVSIIDLKNFNPEKPHFISFYANPNNPASLSDDDIRSIFVDDQNQIWITTYGKGINRFIGDVDKRDFSFQHFEHRSNDNQSISADLVHCITQDKEGNYWIGTQNGLDKLTFLDKDFSTYTLKSYSHNPNDSLSISNNSVKDIYIDNTGIMWIGTRNGFNKFDAKSQTFKNYFVSDGLPNNFIYSIQEDDNGRLWLGTNKGLVCFNKTTDQMVNYTIEDGLADNEFNSLVKFKDKKGVIYMGTIGGLTYFNPSNVLKKTQAVEILFTDIILPVGGEKNSQKMVNPMRTVDISKQTEVSLKYNDFPLYLAFASPKLSPFQHIEYYYKLLPVNTEWNNLIDRKEIQLLNLAPGHYTLQLTGGQNGQIWEENYTNLQLNISPPWWKSVWAYLVYGFLIASLVYILYRFSLQRKLARQENIRLLELDELKTKLFNNITHEFRTPLSVIIGMTQNIIDSMNSHQLEKFSANFRLISGNSKKLLVLINQILDLSKIESGNMQLQMIQADIISYIKLYLDSFSSLAQHKKIDLTFYNEVDTLVMDFDPDKLSIILSNLISNALKFTPENGKVTLFVHRNVTENKKYFILKVKDTGIGISKKHIEHIFDRFYQVDQHNVMEGTGIGLSLTKEIVALKKGKITVKSELKKGTQFTIQLPITNHAALTTVVPQYTTELIKPDNLEYTYEALTTNDKLPLILIVEDNKDIAYFIASCFDAQYNIIFAKDGQEGVDIALERIPDIIITDLMMPETDGLEMTKILKEDERSSHIPIIIVTAKVKDKDRFAGLKYGADAYLTKPFKKEELMIRVEQLILLRKKLQKAYSKGLFTPHIRKNTEDKEALFLNKVIAIIEKDISNSELNAQWIASKMAMSESQLYRKLKALSGNSTAVFIRSVRLNYAKKMLETTDKRIAEVAYDCGFSSPAWFSKNFKDTFDVAPSQIQKQRD